MKNGHLQCEEIDVMFHRIRDGRCAMLVPDIYVQSALFTTKMDTDRETNIQTPHPLEEHRRNPMSTDSLIKRDRRLVDYLQHKQQMVKEIREVLGVTPAVRAEMKQTPRALLVMCANGGHMPLLINFACGLRERGIKMPTHLIFVLSEQVYKTLTELGFTCYYSKLMGKITTIFYFFVVVF